jgi:hypothetical protein
MDIDLGEYFKAVSPGVGAAEDEGEHLWNNPTTEAEIKIPGDTVAKITGRKRLGTLRKEGESYGKGVPEWTSDQNSAAPRC